MTEVILKIELIIITEKRERERDHTPFKGADRACCSQNCYCPTGINTHKSTRNSICDLDLQERAFFFFFFFTSIQCEFCNEVNECQRSD